MEIGMLIDNLTEDDDSDDAFDFQSKCEDMTKKADIIIVTDVNDRKSFRTKFNFSGGSCGCCCDYAKIVKYEFYKVEEWI
jgi:hypothetical protein